MANDERKTGPTASPPATDEAHKPSFAWQPFTARGVAAFASTTFNRVFLVEAIVALLAASSILWFIATAWFPAVRNGIQQLPATGSMRGQELNLPLPTTELLAENRFLSLAINLANESPIPSRADLRAEFHKRKIEVCSLPGCVALSYPAERSWEFNRSELEPLWGAWEPVLLGMAFLGTVAWLLVCWFLMATLYSPFVRTLACFTKRQITWAGSWRLAAASLMPGAMLFAVAILFYGLGLLGLFGLGLAAILHFAVAWVYLILSPLTLPRAAPAPAAGGNPFAALPPPPGEATS